MINSFNAKVAIQFDVNIAIFIQYLSQRTYSNIANKRHIHDGLCWTYDTLNAFCKIFPYFSLRQIRTIIDKCEELNLIKKGNYNKVGYDRTTWFALTPEAFKFYDDLDQIENIEILIESENKQDPASVAICQKWQMHLSELTNRFDESDTTIPTNITTKDISKDISKTPKVSLPANSKELDLKDLKADNLHDIPEQMLVDWISIRKQKKAKITRTAWYRMNKTMSKLKMELKLSPHEAFETMVANCWQGLEMKYFKKDEGTNKKYGTNGKGNPNHIDNISWN